MSTDTVMIGCRLPHGLKLEVGYKIIRKSADGKVFANYHQQENYRAFVLKGTNEHTLPQRMSGIQMPSVGNPEPFINRNVPKDIWDQWMLEHNKGENWYVKSGNLFVVPNAEIASAQAISIDLMSTQAPLAPLNISSDSQGRPVDARIPRKSDKHDGIKTANFKD